MISPSNVRFSAHCRVGPCSIATFVASTLCGAVVVDMAFALYFKVEVGLAFPCGLWFRPLFPQHPWKT
ncbi:protein of unknown function [Hyphomicrobium sp. 1Nfss2.1]